MKFYNDRLVKIIKDKEIKKSSIYKKLNISRPTFWNWENAKTVPSEDNIRKLAGILNINVSDISNLQEKELDHKMFSSLSNQIQGNNWLKQTNASYQERMKDKNNIIEKINKTYSELGESKMVISTLLNNMDIIFYIKGYNNKYITANNNFIDLMKLDRNYNVNGKTDFDVMDIKTAKKNMIEDEYIICNQKKKNYEGIIPNTRKRKWAIIIKTPIFNEDGDVYGLAATYLDITERKKESEFRKLLEKNIDMMDVASAICDMDSEQFLYFNKKALELLNIDDKNDLKGPINVILEKYLKPLLTESSYLKLIKFSSSIDKVFTVEAFVKDKISLIEVRLSFIEHFGKKYIMTIFYDITEIRRLEEKLEVLAASINQVNAVVCILEGGDYEKHKENYYISGSVEKIYGYKKEEFYADNYLLRGKIMHEDFVQGYVEWLTNKNYSQKYKYKIRTKTGETKWCESMASEITYQNKKCIVLIVTEITDRIRREEVLQSKILKIALKMLKKGINIDTIEEITGISKYEIYKADADFLATS